MRILPIALWLACIVLYCTAAFGQIRPGTAATGIPIPPPFKADILDQPESPLLLSIDNRVERQTLGSPLTVKNAGTSVIEAFVLRVDVEPHGLSQMAVFGPKGLAVRESRTFTLGAPLNILKNVTGKPVVSVDLVLFSDGRTWGLDSLKRSKSITLYIEGRSQALSRLKALLTGQDDTDFRRALEVFGTSSFNEPNLEPKGGPRKTDWHSRGYHEVLKFLRQMQQSSEFANELALRIEAMEKSDN